MIEARLLQRGNPGAAVQLCRKILQSEPRCFDALLLLGSCCYQLGQLNDALGAMQQALTVRPEDPVCIQTCGSLLIEAGRFADAVALFDRALAQRPRATPFLFNRGLALAMLGRTEEALADYDAAIALRPDFLDAMLARGNLLRQAGRFNQAMDSFDKVIECDPRNAVAYHARGLLLAEMNRTDEALRQIEKVLELNPGHAGALLDRARLLRKTGCHSEALDAVGAALARDGHSPGGWNVRGTILMDLGRPAEALAAYSRAISLDPSHADALLNRGLLQWTNWRRYDEAVADLERAVALAPEQTIARGELLHIRMYGAHWQNFAREKQILDQGVRAGKLVVRPFAYQALSDSPADLAACARTFARLYPPAPMAAFSAGRASSKIRVGYLSADFRDHATSYLMAGLYERHDRAAFEIVAIDNGHDDKSPIRKRLENAFDHFIDIAGLSDRDAAMRIRAEEIDILVNLNGYFGNHRMGVFARRPAPLQVNYLGFPATLGASYIDYLIADRVVIPENEQPFYQEKIVYLPDCYQANDDARMRPGGVASREVCALPDGAFVFCNFNQSYKLVPDTFFAWMRILQQVPDSVMWLVNDLPAFRANLRNAAAEYGIGPDRLVFAGREPVERHLARLPQADLMLDNLPYNAHTTASDALWMGVPLLTCRGTSFPGRVAASLLIAAGMADMIAETPEAFEQQAVALALDKNRLARLRARLAANRQSCALFNTDRFRRHIEAAFREMQARRLRGQTPASFDVALPSAAPA
ncbi:MAG TPA: tetratricopeptide repeat protein [Rhizomicrobium sp.]|nr:tetratricopeptide repeat protein [Rhizomicrobium sp.]